METSDITKALETAWSGIKNKHPDLPKAMITVYREPVKSNAKTIRRGYFMPHGWIESQDKTSIHEVHISSVILKEGPLSVMETLLHEGAHAIGEVRKIETTSRAGTYHNKRFANLAKEVGLTVEKSTLFGFVTPSLTEEAKALYKEELETLGNALTAYQELWIKASKQTTRMHKLTCQCGRVIRVSAKVINEGSIVCGVCENEFTLEEA